MKLESFHKKLRLRLGEDIDIQEYQKNEFNCAYGSYVLRWRSRDGHATSFHSRRSDDISDPYTDYYAGSYWPNGTQLLNFVCPLPCKYPTGSLVRGKNNKRATRGGYAGHLGLVIEDSGSYIKVRWVDGFRQHIQPAFSYPERDFELVSGIK